MEEKHNLCLNQLPEELQYLAAYARKYHLDNCEDDIDRAIEGLLSGELEDLAQVAERVLWNGDYEKVSRFVAVYEIFRYTDAAWLYFFFGLLDALELKFN